MAEIRVNGMSATDGERHWYIPSEALNEVSWRLRYGKPTRHDLMVASSIIEQFTGLICSEEIYGSKSFRDSGVKFCRDAIKQGPHSND